MRLITLNTWLGRVGDGFFEFIAEQQNETDIFCFQEVYNGKKQIPTPKKSVTNLFSVLTEKLPDFQGFYVPSYETEIDWQSVPYGLAVFVKRSVGAVEHTATELFTHDFLVSLGGRVAESDRFMQSVSFSHKNKQFAVHNIHGLYTGGGKDDTPEHLAQSAKIREAMSKFSGAQILCGDFNLSPNTQSMHLLEFGMRNLVKDNGVVSTRSSLYVPENKFADYILVSPEVEVKKFDVLHEVISDHLPLEIEFN